MGREAEETISCSRTRCQVDVTATVTGAIGPPGDLPAHPRSLWTFVTCVSGCGQSSIPNDKFTAYLFGAKIALLFVRNFLLTE